MVKKIISIRDAITLDGLNVEPSQISKEQRQAIAMALLTQDIGIADHVYSDGSKAQKRQQSSPQIPRKSHVYDHLSGPDLSK